MEKDVAFISEGIELSGVLHTPDDVPPGQNRPAFLSLHGFGGSKIDGSMLAASKTLCGWGYPVLRFDMRGCGHSGGARGHIIPHEQVVDTKNAVTWLAAQPGVDPNRIALLGDSLGAAVSLYTGGTDKRVAGVIAVGGWGNGKLKTEGQHLGPALDKFLAMLEDGRQHKLKTGQSKMVSRFDIVPIPVHMRHQLPPDAIMQFPVETAQGLYDFMPNSVVGQLAPRPLLLMHASKDAVTPSEATLEVFKHAGLPADLVMMSGLDHFPLAAGNRRIYDAMKGWLDTYFPLAR